MNWQLQQANLNSRIGNAAIIQLTDTFDILMQVQIEDLIARWNTQLDRIAISLVQYEFNIAIYDIFYKNKYTGITDKIARIFTTQAPTRLVEDDTDSTDKKKTFVIQAVRLFSNRAVQQSSPVYKEYNISNLENQDEIKSIVASMVNDEQAGRICDMSMEVNISNTDDKQITVRLTENVEKTNGYIPVILEYVFDSIEASGANGSQRYRLALVRFPQDLYE